MVRSQTQSPLKSLLAGFLAQPPLAPRSRPLELPDDLIVHDAGAVYDAAGQLDYLWFELTEQLAGTSRRYFKVVRLTLLTYLPSQEREQSTILTEMQKTLKAVNTARVELVYLSANIREPEDIGIVQIYGAQATAQSRSQAAQAAAQAIAAVVASLRAAYEQARFRPISIEVGEWLRRSFERMLFALVMRGQPDPRINVRGPQITDTLRAGTRQSEVGLEQNEYLYRGMAAGGHEFVNVVLVSRAGDGPDDIYRLKERVATEMSIWGSQINFTKSINAGIALPIMLQGLLAHGASSGYSAGVGQSVQRSQGAAVGQAHTDSVSESQVWGKATTNGESWLTAHTSGRAETNGSSVSHSTGVSDGTSHMVGAGHTVADTNGSSSGESTTHGVASGSSHADSSGQNWSNGITGGGGVSVEPLGIGVDGRLSVSHGDGGSVGVSDGVSSSVMDSSTSVNMSSHAHTEASTTSVADGVNHSASSGTSIGTSHAVTNMESDTQAHGTSISETNSYAHGQSQGQADTRSSSVFGSTGSANSIGLARAQALSASVASGLGAGIVPSLGFSKSYQGIDYTAKLVHDALMQQYRLLDTMALEGGEFVDNYYLVATPEARTTLKGLIAQAFHGVEEVATPVHVLDLTPEEDLYIRLHALAFVPSTVPERSPWALEPFRHTTLMTNLQAATLVAPGLIEHGAALTVQELVPEFANVAGHFREGAAVIGHLYSIETGEVRGQSPIRLTADQLFVNWLFAADTRFGKTVYAQRVVYEMLRQHACRVLVGDFAAGWRDQLRLTLAPLRGAVRVSGAETANTFEFGSLYPNSPRPLQVNLLRVGPHVDAESTLNAIVDLITNAGRLGERQYGFLRETLRTLYLRLGVLTEDAEVLEHEHWGWVQDDERAVINTLRAQRGDLPLTSERVRLTDLHSDPVTARAERRALASHRSRRADLRQWVKDLTQLRDKFTRQPTSFDSIQGIINRLKRLAEGEAGRMFGAGEDSVQIEELAWPRGLAVLEAGAGGRLSDFAKAVLISIIIWRFYTDAVRRWEEARERGVEIPFTVIVIEEANKILGGVAERSGGENEAPRTSELFENMSRDCGKYRIAFIYISQSPSLLPPAIVSSSNNIAVSRLKGERDVRTMMPALGYSPMGFHDNPYYRFISGGIPVAQFITKLGQQTDRARLAPVLMQPLRLEVAPVTDAEIIRHFKFD